MGRTIGAWPRLVRHALHTRVSRSRSAALAVAAMLAVALGVGTALYSAPTSHGAMAAGGQDWPTYLNNVQRTSASGETILSTANAPLLTQHWAYLTAGGVAASPTVVGGVVYVGSWDGYEYALNGTTGALIWKTFLGQTTAPCNPPVIGVTSAAAVQNGVVYVGGGNNYWYALNATNGAVLWSVFTGNTALGWYNWSSPLIVNGYAYIGIASNCDNPLIPGQVLQVSLTTHAVVHTANMVLPGHVGGGAWTSPAYDAGTNQIFVTAATLNDPLDTLPQAIIALDANTLAVKSSWQIPWQQTGADSDWGTSPTLITDAHGNQLVAATNKNGVVYAFNRANLSPGPVWQRTMGFGGECPPCGDGSISSAAFANGVLYVAGGNSTIGGVGSRGYVRALDPATGNVLWEHGTDQPVYTATTYDNGLLLYGEGPTLDVLNAATGQSLYTYNTGGSVYSAPSISNGQVYFGSSDDNVYALQIGAAITPPPDPNCPASFTCQNIGYLAGGGSEAVANGVWTVTAGGVGWPFADSYRVISQQVTGDVQVSADVLTQNSTQTWASAALVVRQSADPWAPFYEVAEFPNNISEGNPLPALRVLYRPKFESFKPVIQSNKYYPTFLPKYLMIQRVGNIFTTSESTDGKNWTVLPGSRQEIVMPAKVMVGIQQQDGLSATTGNSTATYSHVAVGPISTTPVPPAPAHACAPGWSCQDVGLPSPVGDQTYTNGTWTLQGTGPDMAFFTDQFHFAWQTLPGDGAISAHFITQQNTSPFAKAGVMLRQSLDPGSPYYAVLVTPGGGIIVQYRSVQNLRTYQQTTIPGTVPIYLKVARYTDTTTSPATIDFSAYTSADGATWTWIPWSTVALNMSGPLLAGMGATAHAARLTSAVTVGTVVLGGTSPIAPTLCPTGWGCLDVGNSQPAGSQTQANGVYTIRGGGGDIWEAFDTFHYLYQSLPGDGSVSAHLTAQTATDLWAKAGVMLRATTDPGSPYYAAFVTPGHGISIQYRPTQGALTAQALVAGTIPTYLKVARWTDTRYTPNVEYFTAYSSADGTTWTEIPGTTVSIAMTGTLLAGPAVTSHNSALVGQATFDTVVFGSNPPPPATLCPTGWTCADIGAPTPIGYQTLSNGVWGVAGGGGDIWTTADAFHFVWQTLAADGTLSAHLTAQTATDLWAKAGVMLRATTDPGSPYYAAFITPGHGVVVQYRPTQGAQTNQITIAGTLPLYLRVARYTDTSTTPATVYYTAYTSADGTTWTPVSGSTVALTMPGALLAGLAVTSHNIAALSIATLDSVVLGTTAPAPPTVCPNGWSCADIGGATPAGSQALSSGTWSISGGGGDIWGTADAFHFVWQTLAADGELVAQLTAQTATDPWAKAGVMLRATTNAGAPYYAAFITPGHGVDVQYRLTQGGVTQQVLAAGTLPLYLQVARTGTTFTAYTSNDGVTWTVVAGSSVTLPGLSGTVLAGVAVTSHNTGLLSTAVANSVAVMSATPPGPPLLPPTRTPIPTPTPIGTPVASNPSAAPWQGVALSSTNAAASQGHLSGSPTIGSSPSRT